MREFEGANQLHKSNTDFYPPVAESIANAKRAKTPRDLIDVMRGAKRLG